MATFELIPEAKTGNYFGLIFNFNSVNNPVGIVASDTLELQIARIGDTQFIASSSARFDAVHIAQKQVRIMDGEGFNMIETGQYGISFQIVHDDGRAPTASLSPFPINYSPTLTPPKSTVTLSQPSANTRTRDEELWHDIVNTRPDFNHYQAFIDKVLSFEEGNTEIDKRFRDAARQRLPFTNVDEYALVKFATEYYLKKTLNLQTSYFNANMPLPLYQHVTESFDEIENDYKPRTFGIKDNNISSMHGEMMHNSSRHQKETTLKDERTQHVPMIELIWSYWMEQAMLVQTMNAISLRFQNIKGVHAIEPLMRFDTSPLRPLSNLLWGFIQDEQHRTTIPRRVSEYEHAYNLTLLGRAVPRSQGVDNRSYFLEAFHNLLYQASMYFKDFDDMTRRADAFPLLTSLREVHLLLSEGYHNAYLNMTWTTRMEMRMMQYILARPEMRVFLGGRPRVPYPEQWMDKVDTMKQIQGWDNSSTLHYLDLATAGESILLGIRFGDWTTSSFTAQSASNFIITLRQEIQKYISAYLAITGLNLSVDAPQQVTAEQRAIQPAHLIQQRVKAAQRPQARAQMPQRGQLQAPMQEPMQPTPINRGIIVRRR